MTVSAPVEKVFYENYETNHMFQIYTEQYSFRSPTMRSRGRIQLAPSRELVPSRESNNWQTIKKVSWIKPPHERHSSQYYNLAINDTLILKIPVLNKELEHVFLEAKYILDLKEDWDDEGAVGYTQESWEAAANFLIGFNKWLKNIFSGGLYLPKIYHGPKGTIDIVWNENDFRLFLNIDYINTKGTFYSDTPKKQYSEGEFLLNDLKFQMLPLPLRY